MPSGGNTPLNEDDWKYVKEDYNLAVKHRLQYEYLQWLLGGIIENKLPIKHASMNACTEWDF